MTTDAKSGIGTASWIRDFTGALAAGPGESSRPLPLAPDFAQVLARVRTVLTVAETAELVGVKERQVHHWATGTHNPQGEARARLLTLFQIVNNLETQLNPDQIKVWLWSPQPELSGIPIELLKQANGGEVLSATKGVPLREELSDQYLVEIAKGGNASAYDALVRRYRGYARQKAETYSKLGPGSDDLLQEGLLGLYKAIRDYTGGPSDFGEFARHCITRQIIAAVKSDLGRRNARAGDAAQAIRREGGYETASAEFDQFVSRLTDRLPDFQSKVLSLYLDGNSYRRIADELETDISHIETALKAARVQLGKVAEEIDQSKPLTAAIVDADIHRESATDVKAD